MDVYQKAKRNMAVLGVGLGVLALGAITFGVYRMDRNTVKEWTSLTNTIPQMIVEGETDRAREIYVDTWGDINQRIRDAGRHPFGFIYHSDIETLEKDFTWEGLVQRVKNMQALEQRDHPKMYESRAPLNR
ncbi:MAG: hypothetical protein AABY00_02785 [Nanoarchaeota archaeon]